MRIFFFILIGSLFFATSCSKEVVDNKVPIAEAGIFQTTTFPKDSVVLSGIGSDADGSIVAYLWSQVAGSAASIIRNPGSQSTVVKFPSGGNYLFQLMVVDNKGATGVDTVSVTVIKSEVTLTLQPANNPTEMRFINHNGTDVSGPGIDLPVEAWTSGGVPFTGRCIVKFDLSSIPASAQIQSANLYLYSYPSPMSNGNLTDANFGSDNTLLIQQVTGSWSPGSTNWFNMPSSATNNQIVVPHTSQSRLDLNVDVKAMVASMVANNTNYGFNLRLQSEVIYTSRIFVSSYNTTHPDKRPKLVVVYK